MSEIKVDLEVLCECGEELSISKNQWAGQITITPCEKCLQEKYDEGLAKGEKDK